MFKEFKEFALKGNVVDLAIGVIIGAAFSDIVTSLVKDIFTPILGLLLGGVDFSGQVLTLNGDAKLGWGSFIQNIINFILVALVLFLIVKGMNRLARKDEIKEDKKEKKDSEEVLLLREIRDSLKNGK